MSKTVLPSEKAEEKIKEKTRQQNEAHEREQLLRRDMIATFRTAHGIRVLTWLMKECNFGDAILGANPVSGDLDEKRTMYQAMRLNLYIKIRKMLPFNILKEVEYNEHI